MRDLPCLLNPACSLLSSLCSYVSTLRGMSKGRAQYTMQLECFAVTPSHVQEKIVAASAAKAAS